MPPVDPNDPALLPEPRPPRPAGPEHHTHIFPRRVLWTWLLSGVATGVLLAVLFVVGAANLRQGQEKVLEITLERLGRGIQGELKASRVDGNLLTGARLYDLKLSTRDGEPFLVADSAFLDYDLRTLLTPRIHIEKAVLYGPRVSVRRLPGDSLWNYQELFRDTSTVKKAPGPERYTFIDSLRVVGAQVRVQLPWEPTEGLSPRARQREIAGVLTDTSTLLVHRVRGGYLRTINLAALNGRFSRVRFAPGTEAGTFVHVDTLGGFTQFFRQPLRVVDLSGDLLVLDQLVEFDMPKVRLRNSRMGAAGTVRFSPEAADPLYDVFLLGEDVDFRDLRWLYPRFPDGTRGKLKLLVETRSDEGDLLFLARDTDVRAPGTRLVGSFGMILGDTIRFVDVNVRANPLRVATLEAMLPEPLPVVGLRIGAGEIRGTSSASAAPRGEGGEDDEEEGAEGGAAPPAPPRAGRTD